MSFEIAITWEGSEKFKDDARQRAQRASDFTPLTSRFRSVFGEQYQRWFAIYPIGGESNTLQKSLTPPDIVRAHGTEVVVGTDVDYAPFYAEYLRARGRELVPFTGPIVDAFTDTVLDWILEGHN